MEALKDICILVYKGPAKEEFAKFDSSIDTITYDWCPYNKGKTDIETHKEREKSHVMIAKMRMVPLGLGV